MLRRAFLQAAGAAAFAAGPEKKYLHAARTFLDTMIGKGTDRYGKRNTPLFCLSLDPETHAPAHPPEEIDREYARSFEYLYRNYGYYWKSHLHSSGMIYDMGTIRALYALSEAAGEPRYMRAADACLKFFLDNMVSDQTGHFGWGEHIFYNVYLDYIVGGGFTVRGNRNFLYAHELERWTTIYDVFWDKDPEKTLGEIEAIYEYKVIDPATFMNNRHSDYYGGRRTSDTLTFSKHSGLFAHAFAFLHSKTRDPRHLTWARKSAELFWNARHPQTGLIRNDFQRKEMDAEASGMAQLALFLMRAYQWHPHAGFLDKALAYVKAYWKHFHAGGGRFRHTLDIDGTDRKPGEFAQYWEAPIRTAKAAALAYSLTRDGTALELADTVVSRIAPDTTFDTVVIRSLISDEVEARSCILSAALDLYEATANAKYLVKAQALADDSIARFFHRGLIVSSMQVYPEGDKSVRTQVYDGRTGAGWLALNLIRLQRDVDATSAGAFRKFDRLERIYD
jgi:uncharacterized protein YyaL (SSP411 family)